MRSRPTLARGLFLALLFATALVVPRFAFAHGASHTSEAAAEHAKVADAQPGCPNGGGACCCGTRSCCVTPAQSDVPAAPQTFLFIKAVRQQITLATSGEDPPRRAHAVLDTTGPRPPPSLR
jgi:hypothetical protein